MSAELAFIYDQVLEGLVRLNGVRFMRPDLNDDPSDMEEDMTHLSSLLTSKDLLLFAASLRNFSEATGSVKRMKQERVNIASLSPSLPAPFYAVNSTISLYQALSRLIHAHSLRVLIGPLAVLSYAYADSVDFLMRTTKEDVEALNVEPLIYAATEADGVSYVPLASLLDSSMTYLNKMLAHLLKKRVMLSRTYRDP